jgi:hypothetical protein
MAGEYWRWNQQARRYYVTAEGAQALGHKPGTFVSQSQMVTLRDSFINEQKQRTNSWAAELANGRITVQQWTLLMRDEIKNNHIAQYLLAHGGRDTMTPADWGRLGQTIRQQYQYLQKFAEDIASGNLTEGQIAARARMYVESSSQSFGQGHQAAMGAPELPQQPGDGKTQCRSNCKCYWDIRELEYQWDCYWRLNPAEHCPDCLENAVRWNPLTFYKSQVRSIGDVRQALASLEMA